jgi:tetratricopeptide (TPR) repeat protein
MALPEDTLSADARRVALAMALLWTWRPRTAIHTLLGLLGLRRADDRAYTQEDVKHCIRELGACGWREDLPFRDGYYRLRDDVRGPVYRELLLLVSASTLRQALRQLDHFRTDSLAYRWPLYDAAATVAFLRLELLTGAPDSQLAQWRRLIAVAHDWNAIVCEAVFPSFETALFERITLPWRWELATIAATNACLDWRSDMVPACDWALARFDGERDTMPEQLQFALAELLLHRGERDRVRAALAGMTSASAQALLGYALVQEGRWEEAQHAFEAALKRRQVEIGARKRVFAASIAWLYPLALLAQRTPAHLEAARKFCCGEAGKRNPEPHEGWGRWAHAIGVRLGDAALEKSAFALEALHPSRVGLDALWRLLAAAWLGREAFAPGALRRADDMAVAEYAAILRSRLQGCGFEWLIAQVDSAAAVLRGTAPAEGFFASGPGEQWREVLEALQALGTDAVAAADQPPAARIVWAVGIGPHGEL